jgi:hypothetical protein
MPGLSQAHSPARTVAVTLVNPRTLVRDLAGAILAKEHFTRNGGVLYAIEVVSIGPTAKC